VARRAGVSIGSLYQYFPNKDALLAGLLDRHLEQVHAVVERSTAELENPSLPLASSLRSLLMRLVELHERDPQLTRALSNTAFHQHRHGTNKRPDRHGRDYTAWMRGVLVARNDVREGDVEVMAHLLVLAIETLSRWLVHESPSSLERATVVDETLILLTRYVLRDGAVEPPPRLENEPPTCGCK
jgi:AcrR family transcriptional regulator